MIEKNNNGETPFHSACRYLNLPLFDFIVETLSLAELQVIAAYQNNDCAYNAFHLLCLASYNTRVHNFIQLLQSRNSLSEPSLNRYQLGYYNISDNVYLLMKRFGRVFGAGVDNLIMAIDILGNNGLMLCCYSCQPLLIEPCLSLFTENEKLYQAAITALPDSHMSPIKLLCQFGNSDCVAVLFNSLNRVKDKIWLSNVCVEQEALFWCYQSYVEDNKLKDYIAVLDLIAEAYGDRLEEGVVMNSGDCPILIKSLYRDGVILRKLIDKKTHLHFQYEIICHLFFDMLSPISDVARPASLRFFLSQVRKAPENRQALTKAIFAKIFRIERPDQILGIMAKTVVAYMPYSQIKLRECRGALLNIITEQAGSTGAIFLALFYKVTDNLDGLEREYIESFNNNARIMENISDFYSELRSRPETQVLAKNFLERILDSRSILKVAVLQKLSLSDYDRKS